MFGRMPAALMHISLGTAASMPGMRKWMPFFLLPLSSWLVQDCFEFAICWASGLILLTVISKEKDAWLYGLMAICALGAYYEPFILTANIILSGKLEKSRFLTIWTAIFLCISIFPLPVMSFSIYFWGIPFLSLSTLVIFRLTAAIAEKKIITGSFLIITILVSIQAVCLYMNDDIHYGAPGENLSENFILNAIQSGRYSLEDTGRNGIRTSFVFGEGEACEVDMKDWPAGTYYLLGEHDNMNRFVAKNPSFNDDSIRQHEPWAYNRPCMVSFLWSASMKDPFFCSNLGATVKRENWLRPLVWRYSRAGIPQIVIGKKSLDGKSVYLIGDSDIAVKFLAPYNANFLSMLYGQNWLSLIPYIIVLALITAFLPISGNLAYAALCLLPMLAFANPGDNTNAFDALVKFEGIPVKSAHTDNSPENIVNSLSRLGKTVSMGKGNARNVVYIIGNDFVLRDETGDKRTIAFLLPGSSLYYMGKTYAPVDIPQGDQAINGVTIPDARNLKVDGRDAGISLMDDGKIVIVGTASPQRMANLARLLK